MSWRHNFYDQHYARRYLDETDPQAIRFLLDTLNLAPGQRVFDQCCGCGRQSQALAQCGLTPVGVDDNADYLAEAARRCPQGEFHKADALEFVVRPPADGGFNYYSSFGYSPNDAENQRMLISACQSLTSGAAFVLDTINFANLLNNFQPIIEHSFADGSRVNRLSHLDLPQGLLHQQWTYYLNDGTQSHRSSQIRVMLPRELAQMVVDSGFAVERLLGGPDGQPLTENSPRLIVVARKP